MASDNRRLLINSFKIEEKTRNCHNICLEYSDIGEKSLSPIDQEFFVIWSAFPSQVFAEYTLSDNQLLTK